MLPKLGEGVKDLEKLAISRICGVISVKELLSILKLEILVSFYMMKICASNWRD